MKCYKGFDKDLKCFGGFQYEIGKTFETDKADICDCGFHACENPMDVFNYFPPSDSRYCEVELDANDQTHKDSKRVGKRIRIETEIGLSGLISAGVKFILDRVDWKNSAAMNTGDWSAAMNTGDQSAATNTGDRSAATNTGEQSAAMNTGDRSAATVEGNESIAIVTGYRSNAKGAIGCWIVLTERDDDMHILDIKAVRVDGDKIKPDTFYMLSGGEIVEADND